jgi:hypothetical protein
MCQAQTKMPLASCFFLLWLPGSPVDPLLFFPQAMSAPLKASVLPEKAKSCKCLCKRPAGLASAKLDRAMKALHAATVQISLSMGGVRVGLTQGPPLTRSGCLQILRAAHKASAANAAHLLGIPSSKISYLKTAVLPAAFIQAGGFCLCQNRLRSKLGSEKIQEVKFNRISSRSGRQRLH